MCVSSVSILNWEGCLMKTALKLAALMFAGISLTACATQGHPGNPGDVFSGKSVSQSDLDTSRRYYDDLVNRYYYYENGTNRTFFENGDYRSG